MKTQQTSSLHSGFSLVEVTLAVAIAALALITFLGLLPQGLEISRKTALMTTNSNVLEQIVRDLENARWDVLPGGTGGSGGASTQLRYFDDQGVELASNSKNISIIAQLNFSNPASLPSKEVTQYFMRRVVVKIANTSNPSFDFSAGRSFAYSTYNHLVAKTRTTSPQ